MDKTALIYSFNTRNTSKVAEMIKNHFEQDQIDVVNAEDLTEEKFMEYTNYILGIPTWFDGELPNYWDEFVPAIEDMNLKDKKVAIFGLGDYKNYPENYMDAIGLMAGLIESVGGKIVGLTPDEGYEYESSKAVRDKKFLGLPVDNHDNKKERDKKVKDWVDSLKKEFS
jgi:flavodoxin I